MNKPSIKTELDLFYKQIEELHKEIKMINDHLNPDVDDGLSDRLETILNVLTPPVLPQNVIKVDFNKGKRIQNINENKLVDISSV